MSISPPACPPEPDPQPLSGRIVVAYTAAQIGAFIGFVPLLSLLLPLKAASIAPTGKAELLAIITLCGAITAGIANVMAGAFSDHTLQRNGGRWLWLTIGLAATIACYGLFALATTSVTLLIAVIGLQISLNLMLNPLAAVLADDVPDHQKGTVSGFASLAYPVASLFSAILIGVLLSADAARLWAIIGAMLLLVTPFILMARQGRAGSGAPAAIDRSWVALGDHDFRIAFLSRLLVLTAIAMNVLYLLFFLQSQTRIASVIPGQRPEVVLGWILAGSTIMAIIAGLVAGRASDRVGRRRELILGGGLCVAAGACLMALFPQWPGPVVAQIVLGVGIGVYGVVDTALIAQVLPSRANAGRDLGLINLAAAAAQVVAPLLALIAFRLVGYDLRLLFALSAGIAALGAIMIMAIRRVR